MRAPFLKLNLKRGGQWSICSDDIEGFQPEVNGYGGFDGSIVRTVSGDVKYVQESAASVEKMLLKLWEAA